MTAWKIPLFKVHAPPWAEAAPALREVWHSGYWAEGGQVAELESQLAEFFRTPNVFATNSCTNALAIALKMAGVGPWSTVLAPPMTCIATVAPAVMLGARIRWLDVDPKTGMVDPERIPSSPRAPDAVMVVDWGGDVAPITEISVAVGDVPLIEDAAQAMGTTTEGADYRCFSFQAIKLLTTGDGGCCVTVRAKDAERGKSLSWFGINRENFRLPSGEINWDADVPELGFKANMNNLTAAIGLVQMRYLKEILAAHAANAAVYDTMLACVDEVDIPPRKDGSAYWVYTITCDRRDELMAFLQKRGVQASRMHARLDMYSGIPTVCREQLPGVDEFASRVLCLPCGWWMDASDVRGVCGAIREFYQKGLPR